MVSVDFNVCFSPHVVYNGLEMKNTLQKLRILKNVSLVIKKR